MADIFPSVVDIRSGALTAFTAVGGDSAVDTRLCAAVLPPMSFNDTYYSNGLLAVLTASATGGTTTYLIQFYNLTDGSLLTDPIYSAAFGVDPPAPADALLYSGVCSLQRGFNGVALWALEDTAVVNTAIRIMLSKYVTETGGTRRLVTGSGGIDIARRVVDLTPLSKTSEIYLLASCIQTVAGDPQIILIRAPLNDEGWPASPGTLPIVVAEYAWIQDYTLDVWTDRPDSCIAALNVPASSGLDPGIVALMGNWEDTGGIHKAVTNPRLMTADLDGVGQWTFEFGYGRAHGMAVNQFGDVYVAATRDIMNDGPFLVAQYNVSRLGETLARVEHGANGLGDAVGDPDQTRVIDPVWTGSRLIVMDHEAARTRLFVYDRNLVFQGSSVLSSTASPGGSRGRSLGKATTFWANQY